MTTGTNAWLSRLMVYASRVIFVLLPFHAFLTVWLASGTGHYTVLRLWKETLLALMVIAVKIIMLRDKQLRDEFLASKLHQLLLIFLATLLIWGVAFRFGGSLTSKALGYGWIVDARLVLAYIVVWVAAKRLPKGFALLPRYLFWPMAVVVVIALLQYFVLPYDFLKHFGYNQSTIFPYETINHDIQRLRVMSTLRGANPLGAYLTLLLSLLAALWLKQKKPWQAGLFVAGLLALYVTFSRSAWIGLILSLAVIGWASLTSERLKLRLLLVGVVGFVVLAGAGFVFRNNTTLQDIIFHTDDHSKISHSSNAGHASALRDGVHDVVHEPLGEGPGSAGPASVYNGKPARIAENFFIQIGQELGWFGIVLFVSINVFLGLALWQRRDDPLALGLYGALIGLSFVNLLSHAWADDTLAYLYWGLAAIALAKKEATTRVQKKS